MKFVDRFRKGWNVFRNAEQERLNPNKDELPLFTTGGTFGSRRPDRQWYNPVRGMDIKTSVFNRIAVDAANVDIRHVKLDKKKRYLSDVDSGLNRCLTFEANIDQSGTAFRQDIFQTLLEEGEIAVVPIDTDDDPEDITSFKVNTMRVAQIIQWYPTQIRVRCFDDRYNRYEELVLPKSFIAPVENPFYAVMNEPNGTLQRLVRKIGLLDAVDEMIGSGKLDLIIQLPYIVKTDTKRAQAEKRRSELEEQLQGSQYGVAYTDGTERITQLNRPVENNLLKNVESLTKMFYTQLGITEEVLNGTANEEAMTNYMTRTVKPLLDAVVEALRRKFLSRTALSQGQTIKYFQNPFALVPPTKLADLGDKLTRNAILSSNEFRDILGYEPVDDPMANALVNKNMPQQEQPTDPMVTDSNPLDSNE